MRTPPVSSMRTATLLGVAILAACSNDPAGPAAPSSDDLLRDRFGLVALGDVPFPVGEPRLAARIELGRLLFFDPILGGEMDVSCAACHHPDFAFADGRPRSVGAGGVGLGPARVGMGSALSGLPIGPEGRNSPTVLNAAFNADENGLASALGLQFWDGRARGLEEQARGPIASRVEMAGDAYGSDVARDSVVARLRGVDEYVRLFREAFPSEAAAAPGAEVITMDTYGRAVAAYERELVTRDSPFDRYARGEDGALTDEQKRGLELFFTDAGCVLCHGGTMFSDFRFHVLGVPQQGVGGAVLPGDDTGREEATGDPADRYAFRTPTLRNVELTAPYMHDGVLATLEDVVRFYDRGAQPRHPGVGDGQLDPLVRDPLGLTDDEIASLVAFLRSLTDPGTGVAAELLRVPDAVPSGLAPVFGVRAAGGAP